MTDEFSQRVDKLLNEQIFSYSRLKVFETCPFQWYLKYVEKLKEEEALPLMLGKAVHKAIEEKMLGKDDKQALLEGWKEVEFYPIDLIEYQALVRRANVDQGEANRDNVEVELHFVLPLDGEGSPRIQGYIDTFRRIFGTLNFTDWKTNRVMYEPMDNMQIALYAWALATIHNVSEVTGTLFFLRFFKDNAKTKTFTIEEMEQARQWALKHANAVLMSLQDYFVVHKPFEQCFPAKANPGCAHCPFADVCVTEYPKIIESEGVFVK